RSAKISFHKFYLAFQKYRLPVGRTRKPALPVASSPSPQIEPLPDNFLSACDGLSVPLTLWFDFVAYLRCAHRASDCLQTISECACIRPPNSLRVQSRDLRPDRAQLPNWSCATRSVSRPAAPCPENSHSYQPCRDKSAARLSGPAQNRSASFACKRRRHFAANSKCWPYKGCC